MRAFRILGVLLFVGLLVWIVSSVSLQFGYRQSPGFLGLGSAFEGSLQLPAEKITAAFELARTRMLEVNSWGDRLRLAGDLAGWLSFAATAAITLIIGFYGRSPPPAGGTASTDGLPSSSLRAIGFLAALAAVLTASGNISIAKSGEYYKRADTIRDLVVRTRVEVIDAKTQEAAQAALDNLALQITR
jgi:hypothetical protein